MFTSIAKKALAFSLFALFLIPVSNASATRLFDATGLSSIRFIGQNAASNNFRIVHGYGGAFETPVQYSFSVNNDGTATISGILTGGAIVSDTNVNQRLSDSEVIGEFELNYSGLHVGIDPETGNEVVAIGRQPNATGHGTITYRSDFLGGDVTLNIDLSDKFAAPGPNSSTYGNFGVSPFNLIAAVLPNNANVTVLKNWVMADGLVNVFPGTYSVGGDFHATLTEVPEPASAALLGLAMVGGALRRKKQAA
jgi:hypothetical protein